jgi:tyrosinase
MTATRLMTALLLLVGVTGCATVPTRPSDVLPLLEVQLNNTPTHADDIALVYPLAQVPSRIRITNPQTAFGGVQQDVPVVLGNIGACGSACGQVRFRASSTSALVNTLSLVLPRSGAWVPFVLAGSATFANQERTDAVLEVRENRPAGNVLARQGVFVTDIFPFPIPNRTAIVEIARTPISLDDYLSWAPTPATVRLSVPNTLSGPLTVQLRNPNWSAGPEAPGRVTFGLPVSGGPPPPGTMSTNLQITLPNNGAAVDFYVAGEFGHPSVRDKDAIIEVFNPAESDPAHAVIEYVGVMVRIRRDANKLTANERDRLLRALDMLRSGTSDYATYVQIEALAGSHAHSSPGTPAIAFFPWHRAFLLRFERELQGLDPSVALPYWRYAEAAPNVFSPAFMGEGQNQDGIPTVLTSATNPLHNWAIERSPTFAPGASPAMVSTATCFMDVEMNLLHGSITEFRNNVGGFWTREHFGNEHALDVASGRCLGSGTVGWLAQRATAVQDPLFFLLHANTDRLWAKWQWLKGRYDPAIVASYAPAACALAAGQCLHDTMWPWNSTTAPGGSFPTGLGRFLLPPAAPTPANMISIDHVYLWTASNAQWTRADAGLGYSYDDVPPTQ